MATPQTPRAPALAAGTLRTADRGRGGDRDRRGGDRDRRRQQEEQEGVGHHQHDRARPADVLRRADLLQRGEGRRARSRKYTWQQLRHHDRNASRSRSCIPPPCVPRTSTRQQRRRDVAGRHRRHDQDRLLHRRSPTRRSTRCSKQAGAYDPPAPVAQAYKDYTEIYAAPVRALRPQGPARAIHGHAARAPTRSRRKADADQAAADGVFAVMGGPPQAQSFADELAQKNILCVGTCVHLLSRSAYYDGERAVHLADGPDARTRPRTMTTEFIKKQLARQARGLRRRRR